MTTLPWTIHTGVHPIERLRELTGPGVSSVVDGGANKGRTVDRFLALYPSATVYAFEPMPRLARKLAKRLADDPRVVVRPVALGSAPSVLRLNILESATCSSLLPPTGIRDKHADKPMGVAQTVDVDVVRLDAELTRAPDVFKLDLQGFELEALKGAGELLQGMRAVLCEVSFTPMYRGQPLGAEVIGWMESRGFRMEGLFAPWLGKAGEVVSADALFTRG